jgi:hypothetical protein
MAGKLHKLADKHRRARKVYTSIEKDDTGGVEVNEINAEEPLPTLIGMVIVETVLAVVTFDLDSAPESASDPGTQTATPPISNADQFPDAYLDRLRTITDLDFSQKDYDVWNALGIAIVAMQIRKEALKANIATQDVDMWDGASLVDSTFMDDTQSIRDDVDDPDL